MAVNSSAKLRVMSLALLCGAAIAMLAASRASDREDTTEPSSKFDAEKIKGIINEFDVVGASLVKIVDNSKQPLDDRLAAIELLGEMRYLPAIPSLIRQLDLRPHLSSEARPSPATVALGRFGDAIVPSIVEEYVQHKKGRMGLLGPERYLVILSKAGTLSAARIYAKGKLNEASDAETRLYLQNFLNVLSTFKVR